MNSSQLSTFFLMERFRKGLINDHGVGEVVRELHRIYNSESHNIPLNEKDLWSIQRDLLNGSYEFSPLKKVVEVTFPSFSGHPIYDSILQFTYGPFPYFEEEVGGTGVFQDRTVLVAEARDELICRALAAVLRKSLFPLSCRTRQKMEMRKELFILGYWAGTISQADLLRSRYSISLICICVKTSKFF